MKLNLNEYFAMPDWSEAMRLAFDNGCKAREAVTAEREDLRSRSGKTVNHGEMNCPICKTGTLRWQIMPNEHCHMHCNTEMCVSWIE